MACFVVLDFEYQHGRPKVYLVAIFSKADILSGRIIKPRHVLIAEEIIPTSNAENSEPGSPLAFRRKILKGGACVAILYIFICASKGTVREAMLVLRSSTRSQELVGHKKR